MGSRLCRAPTHKKEKHHFCGAPHSTVYFGAYRVSGILPCEEMRVSRRMKRNSYRKPFPERQTGTGIREFRGTNIRSLDAYERARHALRGVCEPMRHSSPGSKAYRPPAHKKEKHHKCGAFRCIPRKRYIALRGDVSFKKNEAEQLYQTTPRAANRYGNLLRPSRLPTRKRRSNVSNPIRASC